MSVIMCEKETTLYTVAQRIGKATFSKKQRKHVFRRRFSMPICVAAMIAGIPSDFFPQTFTAFVRVIWLDTCHLLNCHHLQYPHSGRRKTLARMTVLDAPAVAPSPTLNLPSKTANTNTSATESSKKYFPLSPEQLSSLQLQIYRHTTSSPISNSVLETFIDLINASFTGPYHDHNFGKKQRYGTTQLLLDDLNHSEDGGWVFMLFTQEGKAVAGAKITLSGEGMDGGPGIHTTPNPDYTLSPLPQEGVDVYWLGALGSITPGSGSILISRIKQFLSTSLSPGRAFQIRAYTVAEWGVSEGFQIQRNSPLVRWFQAQGFKVIDYSWKPPGTWDSFYGGCLASIEYTHVA